MVAQRVTKPPAKQKSTNAGTNSGGDLLRTTTTMTSIDSIVLKPASQQHGVDGSAVDFYAAAAMQSGSRAAAPDEPQEDQESERVPCQICGRKFLPAVLDRHIRVCEKVSNRDRLRQENREKHDRKKREKDEKQEQILQAHNADSVPEILRNKPTKQLRAADGGLLTVFECPHCLRFFQQGTYERHYTFCEHQAQIRGGGRTSTTTRTKVAASKSATSNTSSKHSNNTTQSTWNAGVASEGKLTLLQRRVYYKPPPPMSSARRANLKQTRSPTKKNPLSAQKSLAAGQNNKKLAKTNATFKAVKSDGDILASRMLRESDDDDGDDNDFSIDKVKTRSAPEKRMAHHSKSTTKNGHSDEAEPMHGKQSKVKTSKSTVKAVATNLKGAKTNDNMILHDTVRRDDNASIASGGDGDYSANKKHTTIKPDAVIRRSKKKNKIPAAQPTYDSASYLSGIDEFDEDEPSQERRKKTLATEPKAVKASGVGATGDDTEDSDALRRYERQMTQIISRSLITTTPKKHEKDTAQIDSVAESPVINTIICRKKSTKLPTTRKVHRLPGEESNNNNDDSIDVRLQRAEQVLMEAKQSLHHASLSNGHAKPTPTRRKRTTKNIETEEARVDNNQEYNDHKTDSGQHWPSADVHERNELTHSQYPLSVAADQELALLKSSAYSNKKMHSSDLQHLDAYATVKLSRLVQPVGAETITTKTILAEKSYSVPHAVTNDAGNESRASSRSRREPRLAGVSSQSSNNAVPAEAALRAQMARMLPAVSSINNERKSGQNEKDLQNSQQYTESKTVSRTFTTDNSGSTNGAVVNKNHKENNDDATSRMMHVPPTILARKNTKQKSASNSHDAVTIIQAHSETYPATDHMLDRSMQRLQPLTDQEQTHVERRHRHPHSDDEQAIRAQVALGLLPSSRSPTPTNDNLNSTTIDEKSDNTTPTNSVGLDDIRRRRKPRQSAAPVLAGRNAFVENGASGDAHIAPEKFRHLHENGAVDSEIHPRFNFKNDSHSLEKTQFTAENGAVMNNHQTTPPTTLSLNASNHELPKNNNTKKQPNIVDDTSRTFLSPQTAIYSDDFNSPSASDLGIIDVVDDDEEENDDKSNAKQFETDNTSYHAKQRRSRDRLNDLPSRNSGKIHSKLDAAFQYATEINDENSSRLKPENIAPFLHSRSPSRIRQPTVFKSSSGDNNNYSEQSSNTRHVKSTPNVANHRQQEDKTQSRRRNHDGDTVSLSDPKLLPETFAKTPPASATSAVNVAATQMNKLYGINLDKLDDWLSNWDGLSCHWCRFPYPKPPADFDWDSVKYCVRCGTRRLRSSFKRAAALEKQQTHQMKDKQHRQPASKTNGHEESQSYA